MAIHWSEPVTATAYWYQCQTCGIAAISEICGNFECALCGPRAIGFMLCLGRVRADEMPISLPCHLRAAGRVSAQAVEEWFRGLNVSPPAHHLAWLGWSPASSAEAPTFTRVGPSSLSTGIE